MLILIPKPTKVSVVFADTSVLIGYLIGGLLIPGVSRPLEKNLRSLVNDFKNHGIRLHVTPTVKNQMKHRQRIIQRNAMNFGLSPYAYRWVESRVTLDYQELEQRLLEKNFDASRVFEVREFYKKYLSKTDFVDCRKKKPVPSSYPEDSDMNILAEVINAPESYLLCADCDFYSLDEEIASQFKIYVISQENMNRVKLEWGWS